MEEDNLGESGAEMIRVHNPMEIKPQNQTKRLQKPDFNKFRKLVDGSPGKIGTKKGRAGSY